MTNDLAYGDKLLDSGQKVAWGTSPEKKILFDDQSHYVHENKKRGQNATPMFGHFIRNDMKRATF